MWISPSGKAAIGAFAFIKWNDKCFGEDTHTHTHDYSLVDSFTINFLLKAQAHCQCVIYALSTLTHL